MATDYSRRLSRIIGSYESPIVRAYSWGRFKILHQRFMDEVGQYLPKTGNVLDIGCGFGLFGLYFASMHPDRQVHGFDLNEKRIATANESARKLGMNNATFHAEDATKWKGAHEFDAAYMLDIIHHIPREAVDGLIGQLRSLVSPTGVVVIKDVNSKPWFKTAFTWALDKAMDPKTPVHYWPMDVLKKKLEDAGFAVHAHQMVDMLPYPHVIYICRPI